MTEDRTFDQRLRSAFAATSPDDAATADCPSAPEIWDAAVEQLDPLRLRQVLAHVASCPTCTEAWRLAREIAGNGASTLRVAEPPAAVDRRMRGVGWASALAAGLGFALVSLTSNFTLPQGTMARSGDATLSQLKLRQPDRPVSPSECRPRWTEFEGATYDVQVLTDRLELLTERSNLAEPEFRIPGELLASLPGGSELRVHIEVKRGLSGVVADGTFDLRCAR